MKKMEEYIEMNKLSDRIYQFIGGYKPYSSKKGREEHDYLVKEIYKIINS